MTTTFIALDGADTTLLTDFTPAPGGGFTAISTKVDAAFNASNRLRWTGPVNYQIAQYIYDVAPDSADYTVSVTFRWTFSLADVNSIRVRSSNVNREGYLLALGPTQCTLYEVDSSAVHTVIVTVAYADVGIAASAIDTEYVATLTANGTTLTGTFRGVELFSETDATLSGIGYAGIGGQSASGFGSGCEVTDMTIETLGGGEHGPGVRIIPEGAINKSQIQMHDLSVIATFPTFKPVVVHPV